MFQIYLINPFLNILIFLYNTVAFHDLGLAVIFLTIFIRIIFAPFFYKSARNQIIIQRIQPEILKIQHDHKDNKEKQAAALMDLYKRHNVNPLSGFLMLLIQLPVLIAIYRVILDGFSPEILNNLYSFITKPEIINPTLLGLIDLGKRSILIVSLAALLQFIQGHLSLPKAEKGRELSPPEKVGRQMIYLAPVFTIVVLYNLPSTIGLYWLVTSAFSVVQQLYINKTLNMTEERKEHNIIQ